MLRLIVQFEPSLREQCVQRRIERLSDIEIFTLLTQVGWPEAHRKQHALEAIDDLGECLSRRQVAPAGLEGALLHFAPALTHRQKRLNDIVDVEYGHSQCPRPDVETG